MKINNNLSEISAEMLLNYFYPELEEEWTVFFDGSFYRNYNRDILDVDAEQKYVLLSRDSFFKMLPEGLFFDEDNLKGRDFASSYKKQERTRRLFNAAFQPIDTINFRQRLEMELRVSETLDTKLAFVLKRYFDFDLSAEKNTYVRQMARLLPFIREWRADFRKLTALLGEMFNCKAEMIVKRYSDDDNSRNWIPGIEFQLEKTSLSSEQFRELYAETRPLEQFIREWLIPAEMHLSLSIKNHQGERTTDGSLLLDYNAILK